MQLCESRKLVKDTGIVTDQLRSHTPDSETNDSAHPAVSSRQHAVLRQHGLHHGSGLYRIVLRPWMRMNRKRCCCLISRYELVQGSLHLTAEGEISQLLSLLMVQRAEEVDKLDRKIAYYCRLYAVTQVNL